MSAAAAAICAAVLIPLAATASSTPNAPALRSVAPCIGNDLVVWLNTQGNGTAGSIYYDLEFTNLSGIACTISGYPGVSAVNLSGHQLGSAAGRNPQHAPGPVVIANGGTAIAYLQITEAGNFPSATCRMTTAAGIRVYPPNQKTSRVIPYPFSACSRSGPVYLHVEAVEKSAAM